MAHDARSGLLTYPSGDGNGPSYKDAQQWVLSAAAARRLFGLLVGGTGVYAGAPANLAALVDGRTCPALVALAADSDAEVWPAVTSAKTITFSLTSGSGVLYLAKRLWAADMAHGGADEWDALVLPAGTAAPACSVELGTGIVTASAFTTFTASDTAPGAALIGGSSGGLLAANNLSDLVSAALARTNLGLGSAATHASTDFDDAGAAAAISLSGLGGVASSDARLSDARTPTAHKTSHATGGSDALAPSDIGAAAAADIVDLFADLADVALTGATGHRQALNLSGTQYVDHGHSGWTDSQTRWGFACWVRFASIPGSGQYEVLGNFNGGGNRGGCLFLYDGILYALLKHSGGTQVQFLSTFVPGVWYHLAVARTAISGAGKVRVWVNGVYDNEAAITDTDHSGTGAGTIFTGKGNAGGNDIDADVEEVIWWRNSLWTNTEAAADFNGGDGVYHTAGTDLLVFHYDGTLDSGTLSGGSAAYVTGVLPTVATDPAEHDLIEADGAGGWRNVTPAVVGGGAAANTVPLLDSAGLLDVSLMPADPTSGRDVVPHSIYLPNGLTGANYAAKFGPPASWACGAEVIFRDRANAEWLTDGGGSSPTWRLLRAGVADGTVATMTSGAGAASVRDVSNWDTGAIPDGYRIYDEASREEYFRLTVAGSPYWVSTRRISAPVAGRVPFNLSGSQISHRMQVPSDEDWLLETVEITVQCASGCDASNGWDVAYVAGGSTLYSFSLRANTGSSGTNYNSTGLNTRLIQNGQLDVQTTKVGTAGNLTLWATHCYRRIGRFS